MYIAKVIGKILDSSGEINVPIIADAENSPKQKVDFENGKESRTIFKVIQKDSPLWELAQDQFSDIVPHDIETTVLELRPETGR